MNILALIETATQARNSPKLFRWAQDCRNEGHTITMLTVDAARSVADVAALIASFRPDHVQIFGHVPVPLVYFNPDGHGGRPGSLDCVYATDGIDGWGLNPATGHFEGVNGAWGFWPTAAVRSVSRVYFEDMPNICPDPGAAMDAFLDRNHAYRTGTFSYSPRASLVCYLDYLFPGLTAKLIADLTDVVGATAIDNLNFTNVDDAYHWFTVNAGKTFLAGALFDGGISRGGDDGGIGEFNTGSEDDFASGNVQICALLLFCSWAWQWDVWPLMRAALVGGSQFVWYNPWAGGSLSGWDEQTPIAKIVQCVHTQYSQSLATGIGDGTLRRMIGVVDDMSQADIDRLNKVIADLAAFQTAVIAAVPALQQVVVAPPPPPGTNYAAASNGGTATASSSIGPNYGPDKAINGNRTALDWNSGGSRSGWNSAVENHFPEWLRVAFAAPRDINRVVLYSLNDAYENAGEPGDTTTFTLYDPIDFTVSALVGTAWQTVATVTGNNLVKRTVTFPTVPGASAVEVNITKAGHGYARVLELEVYGP